MAAELEEKQPNSKVGRMESSQINLLQLIRGQYGALVHFSLA